MLEALAVITNLLEKVSVLVSTALVLVLLRPAEVWLGETGRYASPRRRLFLFAVFAAISVWGIFLGFEIDGVSFNTRAVGVIVAGYLGGRRVGSSVGAIAGGIYAFLVEPGLAVYVFLASVIDGGLAGLFSRRFGTSLIAITLGALAAQLIHHAVLGVVFWLIDSQQAIAIASNIGLHSAKVAANTIGVVLFMALLNLTRELEQARADAKTSHELARSAKLEALQYQLQPHFLFNLLNTLAFLIRTNPIKARELTIDLADFLRYTLSQNEDQRTLHDELTQIERYVELERARFGDGLEFTPPVLDDELSRRIILPPLILQPLVENALRHGARDGRVRVEIDVDELDNGDVWIRVLDNGPGPPTAQADPSGQATTPPTSRKKHRSIGLDNVRERLERFFDENVSLTLRARSMGGACAEFKIPAHEADESSGLRRLARQHLRDAVIPPS